MKVAFVVSGLPDGLKCLENNRNKVAEALRNYGWIVGVETTFYSQASLLSTIKEYKNKEIDDFIFFYTGHGDASSDEGILTLRLHDGTTIDINTLHREYFSNLTIKRQAIILDACYSGNFEGRRFHDKTEYLCSSDFDEESYEDTYDGGLQQSYFSYFFCEALEKLEGVITLDLIENYLKSNVDVQKSKYISIDSKMVIVDKSKIKNTDKVLKISDFNEKNTKNINQKKIEKILDDKYTPKIFHEPLKFLYLAFKYINIQKLQDKKLWLGLIVIIILLLVLSNQHGSTNDKESNFIDLKGRVIENNEENISIGHVKVYLKDNPDKYSLTEKNNGTFIIKKVKDKKIIMLCYEKKKYKENYCLPYKKEGKNNVKLPK